MTYLAFTIDDRRYALPAADVFTVVPAAPLRAIDGTPAWVAGVLPFFEHLVPVIDLCQLQARRSSRRAFSTRIVVAKYQRGGGEERPLGLLAEQVSDVLDVADTAWRDPGLSLPDTPWLGPLAEVDGDLVQRIRVTDLLPEAVRERLFP